METQTEHLYVVRNKSILNGEPIIKGTRTPVRAIVEWWRTGVAPEEIPIKLPHLSLAKVFDALSYYCEHTDEIHRYIEQNRTPEYMVDPLERHVK